MAKPDLRSRSQCDVLTVVLVHWNQPERCLKTVAAFEGQGVPVRITVVDNGSSRDGA